jgi:hypothetical protein
MMLAQKAAWAAERTRRRVMKRIGIVIAMVAAAAFATGCGASSGAPASRAVVLDMTSGFNACFQATTGPDQGAYCVQLFIDDLGRLDYGSVDQLSQAVLTDGHQLHSCLENFYVDPSCDNQISSFFASLGDLTQHLS